MSVNVINVVIVVNFGIKKNSRYHHSFYLCYCFEKHRVTAYPLINRGRDPVEQPDQQGILKTPDGLELRVSSVLNVKSAQSTNDLHKRTNKPKNNTQTHIRIGSG